MKKHKDSQCRYYKKNGYYFITVCTYAKYAYFDNDVLCELFVEEMNICKRLKSFDILGYKINPDHVHLMLSTPGECNYSEIMRSLKTNFARNANRIMGYNRITMEPERESCMKARSRDLAFIDEHMDNVYTMHRTFIENHGNYHQIPKFKWQKSFHDHVIRVMNPHDYQNHIKYIRNQWLKHNLPENKWCRVR
ncbi:transposase [Candidatus Margulisiibacteriota bacterium]